MSATRENGMSATSARESTSPSSDSVTHAATRWLAAMNDSDASEGESHAAVVMPRVKKELPLVSKGESDAGGDRNEQWHKREFQEDGTALQTPKKRAKRKSRKSTIDIRKVRRST